MFSPEFTGEWCSMAPKANSKQSPRENPAAVAESPESLDKVRDILFGSHMRSVEGRIARIEERLLREQQTLRADLEAGYPFVDGAVVQEFLNLTAGLKNSTYKSVLHHYLTISQLPV